MLATELSRKLSPFGAIVNESALSVNYRALYLTPTFVCACAAFGSLEMMIEIGLDREIYIDATTFLNVIKSLPAAELELTATDAALKWKCGSSHGQIALLNQGVVVTRPEWPEKTKFVLTDKAFGKALDLSSLSCGSTSLLSVGLYGIVLDNSTNLTGYSSDNNTFSSACLGGKLKGNPDTCCLSPESAKLIGMLSGRDKAAIAIDGTTSVFMKTVDAKLVIKQIPPLKFDIKGGVAGFRGEKMKINLHRDVVTAFIRRAEALAEDHKRAYVDISVDNGAVRLAFAEGKASSEEFYLVEGGPEGSVAPITVDSRRLARALAHATSIVFDYHEALVLRGPDDFIFVIAGKPSAAAVA